MNKSDKENLSKCLEDLNQINESIEEEINFLVKEIIGGGSKNEPSLNVRMFHLTETQARLKVVIERIKGE